MERNFWLESDLFYSPLVISRLPTGSEPTVMTLAGASLDQGVGPCFGRFW